MHGDLRQKGLSTDRRLAANLSGERGTLSRVSTLAFDDLDGVWRYARELEELAQLLHVLRAQLLGLRLVEDVPVLANRQQDPAIRLLTDRAGSLHKMQRVRPGEIVCKGMTEDRIQRAPVTMGNSVS